MENMRVSRERTTARCAECGKPVEQKFNAGKQDEEILCFRCQALKAVAQLPSEKSTASAASRMDAKRVKLLLQVFIVVACFAIVAFQMPEVLRALREKPKPVRYGSYDTDPIADQCLENMWRAIKLVQEGKKVPPDLTCPASGNPYKIETVGDEIEVSCPNPEKHGFVRIFSKSSNPVPQLVSNP